MATPNAARREALHEEKEFIMNTRRHVGAKGAPLITLVTSSIAVTRAKRVSFTRIQTLLEAKGVKFDHVDLALQVARAGCEPCYVRARRVLATRIAVPP